MCRYQNEQNVYISIGFGIGFLICLIVEPGSLGLNGACLP